MVCASGVDTTGVCATPFTVIVVEAVPWIGDWLVPSNEVTVTFSVSVPSYSLVGV
jgi:hypothetical protein